MEKIYIDNEFVKLYYVEEDKMIISSWKKTPTSEIYREVFEKLYDVIVENSATKFLSDTKLQGAISPEDRNWLSNVMMHRGLSAGLTHIATVLAKDVFKKYYLSKLQKDSTKVGMYAFEMFDDFDKAKEWLLSQE